MRALAIPILTALIAVPAVAGAAPSDRHPGFYRFAPAAPETCREKHDQRLDGRLTPQRLGELPAAYAVRIQAGKNPQRSAEREACYKLLPSR